MHANPDAASACPACGSRRTASFYTVTETPAHSVRLMRTAEEAVSFPRGTIDLRHCAACGFVFNAAFDESLQDYSEQYEETQGFSGTFRGFHTRLAEHLVERWDIRGKHVLEIGCGKGEFLALLCELGGNTGVGFDPAFVPERRPRTGDTRVQFRAEPFPPRDEGAVLAPPDLVCCKMTLEHIPAVRAFLMQIRSSLPAAASPVTFFQVPDAERIVHDGAYWDVYYEHCSYFTRRSLRRLFEACGFEVLETWTDYQDQYLMIVAVPAADRAGPESPALDAPKPVDEDVSDWYADLETFAPRVGAEVSDWRRRLREESATGGRICVWGGGSKAVAFLSALGEDLVDFVVDINPHRSGTYLPGSGLEIVAPAAVPERAPTLVVAMNPVYRDEIAAELGSMDVAAELVALR